MSIFETIFRHFKEEKHQPSESFWLAVDHEVRFKLDTYPRRKVFIQFFKDTMEAAKNDFWSVEPLYDENEHLLPGDEELLDSESHGVMLFSLLKEYFLYRWLERNNYIETLLQKYLDLVVVDDYGDWDFSSFYDELERFSMKRHMQASLSLATLIIPAEILAYAEKIDKKSDLIFSDEFDGFSDFKDDISMLLDYIISGNEAG